MRTRRAVSVRAGVEPTAPALVAANWVKRRVLVLLLTRSLLPRAAFAQESVSLPVERTYSADYIAAPGCPGLEEFDAAIRMRVPRARRMPRGSASVHLKVSLFPPGSAVVSSLSLSSDDGEALVREVASSSCAAAADAMAVIAAVALDSNETNLPSIANDSATPRAPAPRATSMLPPPIPDPNPAAPSHQPTQLQPTRAQSWRWGIAGAALLQQNVGPGLAPGASLGVHAQSLTAGPFAPSVRLRALGAWNAVTISDRGSADFRLFAAQLELCPFRLRAGALSSAVCSVFDAGELRAAGKRISNQLTRTMPWLGGGLALRLELTLTEGLVWALGGAVEGRLRHDHFIFNPHTTVYQLSAIDGYLSTGFGLSLD